MARGIDGVEATVRRPTPVPVTRLERASAACHVYIGRDGLGAGNWAGGIVSRAEVRVSWNREGRRTAQNGAVAGFSGVEPGLERGMAIRLAVGFDEGTLRRALSVMAERGAGC